MSDQSDSRNYTDFDVNQIPWDTFPEYIQSIVYMGLDKISTNTVDDYKAPLVYVQVGSNLYSVYVGIKGAFGQYVDASGVPQYMRLFRFKTFSDSTSSGSAVYYAQFSKSDNSLASDWRELSPTSMGDTGKVEWYSGSTILPSQTIDLYIYGNNSVKVGDFAMVEIPVTESGYKMRTYLNNTGGGSFLNSYGGVISSSDAATYYQNVFCSGFRPLTVEQIQEHKEEARHEEQKSWFERLGDRIKGFFENLVEDIKGLFIPSSDFFAVYFDELQTFFRERLGFVYELPEFIISIFNKLINYNPKSEGYSLTFPSIQAPKVENGEVVMITLTEEREFSFDFLNVEPFKFLYSAYKSMVWLSFCFLLMNLVKRKYDLIVGGK